MIAGSGPTLRFPERLRGRIASGPDRFIVTGAGGWFGRATLELLDEALGDSLSDRVAAFAASGRSYRLRSGRELALAPLSSLRHLPPGDRPTHLAHYAFLTREKVAGMPAERYVAANREITRLTTEAALRLGVSGAFTTSSGAIYDGIRERELALAGNPYGALKLEEEEAFSGLSADGVRTAICRVFNVSGPFINKDYALGSFLGAALRGEDIRIAARTRVVRSYVHVRDIVAAGFSIMLGLAEPPARPFDTAGAEVVEVGDLARRIRAVLDLPQLGISRDPMIEAPEHRYVGDGARLEALARRTGIPLAPLDEQIRDTAAYMESVPAFTRAAA